MGHGNIHWNIVFLSCVFGLSQAYSNTTTDKEELLSWTAPREFQVKFPYYFTGYDDNGSPVFMGEFGKWNLIDELAKGPASEEMLTKFGVQFYLRVAQEGVDTPGSPGSIVIADISNFTADSRVLNLFSTLTKEFDEINRGPGLKAFYAINANQDYIDIFEKEKHKMTHVESRFHVYGEDATKWDPEVLKYLKLDGNRLRTNYKTIAPLKETLNQKILQPVDAQYVNYFSGYSKRGSPVFIHPFGRWDFRAAVEKGHDGIESLGRLHDQMNLRWNRAGIEAPGSPGSIVIMDAEGFGERQSSHKETVKFVLDLMRRGDKICRSSGIAHIYFINDNPHWNGVYSAGKSNLATVSDYTDTFGEDSSEWKKVLLEEISPDQLPEDYGGSKAFTKLKIFGAV